MSERLAKLLTVVVIQALLLLVGREEAPALELDHLPMSNEYHQA
jgi:hypothetical protein